MSDNMTNNMMDEEMDLEALAAEQDEAADLSEDNDIEVVSKSIADDSDVEDEKYEKQSNFNNNPDFLRKFSESFSTQFVLSPQFSGMMPSNNSKESTFAKLKAEQDAKAEKQISDIRRNRPKPALLKKLAGE